MHKQLSATMIAGSDRSRRRTLCFEHGSWIILLATKSPGGIQDLAKLLQRDSALYGRLTSTSEFSLNRNFCSS